MVSETTMRRIGNSQGITIPKDICDALGIAIGQRVRVSTDAGGIRIEPVKGKSLRGRMTEWDGIRYQSPEVDWGKPVGNEMW